jgi:hypothetical protein
MGLFGRESMMVDYYIFKCKLTVFGIENMMLI